jgi:flagellar biosynthetic protein FlhB
MPEKPATERTEQPTAKRLEKAREEGQVPQSQELVSVATLMALVLAVTLAAPKLGEWFSAQMREGMSCNVKAFGDVRSFTSFINSRVTEAIVVSLPILAAMAGASALASVAVGGLIFSPSALRVRWDVINPASGMGKLINGRSFVHLFASIFKLLFVSLIAWYYLQSKFETLAGLRWAWSGQLPAVIGQTILGLMIRMGIALLAIALADVLYQRWKYIDELKMSRQEVKQEHKDYEGSPEVRARIRRVQFEMAMRRISAEVPKASVVLVNPTHVAVALRYEVKTMEAPMVVAKGADHLAEKIREIARAYGIPVIRRPELARTIYATVKPGHPIPESLFVTVAEVLALVYRLRRSKMNT